MRDGKHFDMICTRPHHANPDRRCPRNAALHGFASAIIVLLAYGGVPAQAQDSKAGRTPSPPGAAVYFVDIKDGATVPRKFTIHFGLRGMGIAPAGMDRENSGHHHLIIDAEVPPVDHEIPNDFNHLHFGGGQTEVELNLPPGPHTLQLVLGDKDHIAHNPPVMSERIRITVAGDQEPPRTPDRAPDTAAKRKPAPPDASVYFVYPRDGARIFPRSTVRFGLSNMGVAPAGVEKSGTGHHHLLVDTELPPMDQAIPNDFNHLHFGAGQTEVLLKLTNGKHTLQLLFADENHIPHDPPIMSERITVIVDPRGPRGTGGEGGGMRGGMEGGMRGGMEGGMRGGMEGGMEGGMGGGMRGGMRGERRKRPRGYDPGPDFRRGPGYGPGPRY
jgi:hypothetical protein